MRFKIISLVYIKCYYVTNTKKKSHTELLLQGQTYKLLYIEMSITTTFDS